MKATEDSIIEGSFLEDQTCSPIPQVAGLRWLVVGSSQGLYAVIKSWGTHWDNYSVGCGPVMAYICNLLESLLDCQPKHFLE